MATLVMQCVVAVLTLAFGLVAVRVAFKVPSNPELPRAAWLVTGIVFTVLGISTAVHNCIAAPWAYLSGPGTPAYELFLRWSPVGNHSRGLVVVAYGMIMAGLVVVRRVVRGHYTAATLGVSAVAMTLGGMVGWREGPLVRSTHYTAMAVSDAAELILLFSALLVGVIWNTTDRLLWVSLVIFTVHELFDVTLYTALAWGGVPGAWRPRAVYIHLYASIAYLVMIGLALRRAKLASRGAPVPGLLDLPAQAKEPLMG